MKNLTVLVLCIFLTGPVMADSPLAKVPLINNRVLWLGDSITQMGDYVTFVEYYLNKQFPLDKVDIISIGLSSETVSGLSEKTHPFPRPWVLERSQRALDMVKPKIVVGCYGMNDGIYHPQSSDRLQAFQDGINKLISQSKAAGAQVVLLTPPPFDKVAGHNLQPKEAPDFGWLAPYEDYDSVLGNYAKWELSLPSSSAYVIDLHTPIDDYLANRRQTQNDPHFSFTKEGIHPNPAGHLLMAEIILKGLGYSIPFDPDLDKELAKVTADPLYALIKQQRENRSGGWLTYVGYTRDGKFKTNSVDQSEKINNDLQGQIDNIRNKAAP